MIVLGCDPGLANFGIAVVELEPLRVITLEVLRTKKSTAKALVADDNVRRSREIAASLLELCKHRPVAICAEAMSHPRNASAAGKLSMSWGVLSAISALLDIPIVQASPQRIKKATCGRADASKAEVQRALVDRFGALVWPTPGGVIEHAADALGAVIACLDSDVMRMARQMGRAA